MRSRPMPTMTLVAVWLIASLVGLGIALAAHPPIPDEPIFRSVATTEATR